MADTVLSLDGESLRVRTECHANALSPARVLPPCDKYLAFDDHGTADQGHSCARSAPMTRRVLGAENYGRATAAAWHNIVKILIVPYR